MNISAPFIRRTIGTTLVAAGLLVAGAIAYFGLGVAPMPNIDFPVVWVAAQQPGADAETMSTTVTAPLERQVGQIPGVSELNSDSSQGRSTVIVLLDPGTNVDDAAREANAAINTAMPDLPSGIGKPASGKANPNGRPVLLMALASDSQDLARLYDLADTLLKPRIKQILGVADVDVAGGSTPSIRIDVDMQALSSMGLSFNQIRNTIRAANNLSPLGTVSDGRTQMLIGSNSQIATPGQYADLVIANQNGTPVRLKDIAHVYQGQADQLQAAWFGSRRAVLLVTRKDADANIIKTVERIKAQVPGLRALLPADVTLTPFLDRTPTIRDSIDEVQITLLIAIAAVIGVLLVFLRRWTPTLIAALAIPMSLAGAFVAMYILGYTLNNFSLMALVIAIGFVVDDAIVVIENITRHLDSGKPRFQAALDGAREIGFTVVSITASLLAVLLPLLFAPGFLGLIFGEFSWTLAAAIAISGVVSLTLTPSLCGRFLRPHAEDAAPGRFAQALERMHGGMTDFYRRGLDFSLRHRRLMALQPLALVFLTVYLFTVVPSGNPVEDTGQIIGRTSANPDVSYSQMVARQQSIIKLIMSDPAVAHVGSRLGGWHGGGGASGRLFIDLKTQGKGRDATTDEVAQRIGKKADKIPGIDLRMHPLSDFGGGGDDSRNQYGFALEGSSYAQLQTWANKLVLQLRKQPMFTDIGLDSDARGLEEHLAIDRDAAARYGVSVASIAESLYNAFAERPISTIYSGINDYSVILSALPAQTDSPQALDRIHVRANGGAMIPLSALTTRERGLTPNEIGHHNQMSAVDISFNLAKGKTEGQAMDLIRKTVAAMRMPNGISMQATGGLFRFQQQMSSFPLLLLGAILAVYLVLGILYESLIHPVTILSTLPAAGVGALLALLAFNMSMSMISFLAFIMLIGIVKKNAIMMIDFALSAQRERGLSNHDAIREACLVRFRPIMMTTMVAILAAMPLAIGYGAGAAMRRPLGVAMIGGLIVSQALTLLSTPALFLVFANLADRRRARRTEKRQRKLAAAH